LRVHRKEKKTMTVGKASKNCLNRDAAAVGREREVGGREFREKEGTIGEKKKKN